MNEAVTESPIASRRPDETILRRSRSSTFSLPRSSRVDLRGSDETHTTEAGLTKRCVSGVIFLRVFVKILDFL